MMANTESMIKQLIMAKSTKPSPNESTTPTLKARGARCVALGSGPWGLALGPRCHEIGSVTPELGSEIQ